MGCCFSKEKQPLDYDELLDPEIVVCIDKNKNYTYEEIQDLFKQQFLKNSTYT